MQCQNLFCVTTNKLKTRLISALIFLIVFCIIGIPWTSWWFNGDDFHGIFLGYKCKSFKDLFYFFYDGHTNHGIGPTNGSEYIKPSFFGAYYRPLYCIYLTIQFWLFGTNAYLYFLTNVFFHAINTTILFNIFSTITTLFPATLVALLFAFHPQIAYRFGAIVNLHYYINTMLVLLIFILFKRYLDTQKTSFYLLAILLFIISLFTRESSIVLPAMLFLGTFIYPDISKNFINQIKRSIIVTSGFWGISLAFLALRAYLYPIAFEAFGSHRSTLLNSLSQIQVLVYDILGISWLPWGHKILRGSITLTLILLLFYLFIKCTKKLYVLYFLSCAALMVWPGYIGCYSPRYFYEIHPFLLLALVSLLAFNNFKNKKIRILGILFLSSLVLFYISFLIINFEIRNKKHGALANACIELCKNPEIKNKSLCFLSWPTDGFGDHCATIFWILLDNPKQQIFCDSSTALMQADSNIIRTTRFCNICSKYYTQNYIDIIPAPGGFRFKSLNLQKIFFDPGMGNGGYSIGKKIINKKETVNNAIVVTDFTILIDKKYLDQNPVFIKWNYANKKFEVIHAIF